MIPTRVGQRFGGGFFTGVIRVGESAYAIIVAPKSTEVTGIPFQIKNSKQTPGKQLANDGKANTLSINNSFHPAAQYCCNMAVGGYADWYLPSRDELELCYRYLKPTTESNFVYSARQYFTGNLSLENGSNPNSIPVGTGYTTTNPTGTIVTIFYLGSVEAFETNAIYWSSTEYSATTSCVLFQSFRSGRRSSVNKIYSGYNVRAARRTLIAQGD